MRHKDKAPVHQIKNILLLYLFTVVLHNNYLTCGNEPLVNLSIVTNLMHSKHYLNEKVGVHCDQST